MLLALLLSYLLGGDAGDLAGSVLSEAWLDDARQRVRIVVTDPQRRRAALEDLDAIGKELERFEKRFNKSMKPLAKAYGDHGDGVERMRAELATLDGRWVAAQERMLDLRYRLRESLTREEWRAVFEAG